MPYNPERVGLLAQAVARVYGQAELSLLEYIAALLNRGIDTPGWAQDKLDASAQVRRRAERLLTDAHSQAAKQARQSIREAARRGTEAAVEDMSGLSSVALGTLRQQALGNDALDELASAIASEDLLPPTRAPLRTVVDIYRRVVEDQAARALAGAQTRREATQQALSKWAAQGITGFTDESGRRWTMESYAEMSMRTATARASLDGHTRSLSRMGQHLVYVSDAPQECEWCRPYEGAILSTNGATGTVQVESATGPGSVEVEVAATLEHAREDGLFHPNCRHSASAYLPGATSLPTDTADEQGSQARQQLRYLERQVRGWKKRQAAAMSPAAEAKAKRRVAEYRARIRQHVKATPAKRQRDREQVGKGL